MIMKTLNHLETNAFPWLKDTICINLFFRILSLWDVSYSLLGRSIHWFSISVHESSYRNLNSPWPRSNIFP